MLSVEDIEVIVTDYISDLLGEQSSAGSFSFDPEVTAGVVFTNFAEADVESLALARSGDLQVGVASCLALHVSLVCDVFPQGDVNRNALVGALMGAVTEVSASIVDVATMALLSECDDKLAGADGANPQYTELDIEMMELAKGRLNHELKLVDPKVFSLPNICLAKEVRERDWDNMAEWHEWLSKFNEAYSELNPQLTPDDVSQMFGSLDQRLLQQSFLARLKPSEAAKKISVEFKEL